MSQPKQMTFTSREVGGGQTSKTEWVLLEDYELLKAEVERLRKAGDSLVYSLQWCDWGSHIQTMDSVNRWNAAKEGKPSV